MNIQEQTDEQFKLEVITELYKTGRYKGKYFNRTSKSKVNPIKSYISIHCQRNGIKINEASLIDDCYDEIFYQVWKIPATKFRAIMIESPNGSKLNALVCRIAICHCFSVKNNPASSGVIHNIMNNSNYRDSIQIDYVESYEEYSKGYITRDTLNIDDTEPFERKHGHSPEDIIKELTEQDKKQFDQIIGRQPQGKRSKATNDQREELYNRIREIKNKMDKRKEIELAPEQMKINMIKETKENLKVVQQTKTLEQALGQHEQLDTELLTITNDMYSMYQDLGLNFKKEVSKTIKALKDKVEKEYNKNN